MLGVGVLVLLPTLNVVCWAIGVVATVGSKQMVVGCWGVGAAVTVGFGGVTGLGSGVTVTAVGGDIGVAAVRCRCVNVGQSWCRGCFMLGFLCAEHTDILLCFIIPR